MILRTISLILLLSCTAALLINAPARADAAEEWRRGFNIQMPAISRSITLIKGVDPDRWANRMGLSDYQIESLGERGSIVNVAMEDQRWQQQQARLCGASEVVTCENTQCQQIQLSGRVRPGPGIQSFRPRLRLVKNTPEIEQLLNPDTDGQSDCSTGPVDFTREIPMLSRAPQSPNYQIDPGQLPDNPQCWNLVVESACSMSSTPLDSLVPAREPKRVLALLPTTGVNSAPAIAAAFGLRILRQTELKSLNQVLVVLEISGTATVDGLLPQLIADGRISAAQPEFIYRTSAEYGDPYAAMAYGPKQIGAPRLHASATGKGGLVALIDTGVDSEHPELRDNIVETHDLTGNGWSADLHGTAIAGIIAAKADNGIGSYGVAPNVKILALKACQPKQAGKLGARCWTSTLVQALDLAMQKQTKIINMSLGGPPDELVTRVIRAAQQQGHLIIAAAGNGGPHAKPAFPAALDEVVAVTAVDALEKAYRQANIGDFIELAAPGVDIVSVTPGDSYPVLSGTSMASAHVAGAAALLAELMPTATARQLRDALADNVIDLGQPGPDRAFGRGRIDICKAAATLSGGTPCGSE